MKPTDFRNLNDPEENQSSQFSFNKNYLYCLLIFIFTINLTWRRGIGLQHGSYHCWLDEPLEKSILHNSEKQILCNRPYIQVLFTLTLLFLFSHVSHLPHLLHLRGPSPSTILINTLQLKHTIFVSQNRDFVKWKTNFEFSLERWTIFQYSNIAQGTRVAQSV